MRTSIRTPSYHPEWQHLCLLLLKGSTTPENIPSALKDLLVILHEYLLKQLLFHVLLPQTFLLQGEGKRRKVSLEQHLAVYSVHFTGIMTLISSFPTNPPSSFPCPAHCVQLIIFSETLFNSSGG